MFDRVYKKEYKFMTLGEHIVKNIFYDAFNDINLVL